MWVCECVRMIGVCVWVCVGVWVRMIGVSGCVRMIGVCGVGVWVGGGG